MNGLNAFRRKNLPYIRGNIYISRFKRKPSAYFSNTVKPTGNITGTFFIVGESSLYWFYKKLYKNLFHHLLAIFYIEKTIDEFFWLTYSRYVCACCEAS
ncbi:hypothetical protein WQ57_21490 [Mesobacillus campisalis]|uniref:Uncharacterized protein n=1 Tax=Mesobacillus campisalis TaxID=1408103 RepID=A0A0M2SN36_9BACI|nr:hypothetical protein WQ57_21490 [Mesobacillus campisalis]